MAAMAAISAAPRINVVIPAGVVRKKNAMSTSATTRFGSPGAQCSTTAKLVAGISDCKGEQLVREVGDRKASPCAAEV